MLLIISGSCKVLESFDFINSIYAFLIAFSETQSPFWEPFTYQSFVRQVLSGKCQIQRLREVWRGLCLHTNALYYVALQHLTGIEITSPHGHRPFSVVQK